MTAPTVITVIVSEGFNLAATMSFLDPFRALNYLQGSQLYSWEIFSADGGQVRASNGLSLDSSALVDGTIGDLVVVSTSWGGVHFRGERLLANLRKAARSGAWLVGLDTGAFALAAAGLAAGKRITVHYEQIDALAELHRDAIVTENLLELDAPLATSAGGIAAGDLALRLIEQRHDAQIASACARYLFHGQVRTPNDPQALATTEPLGAVLSKRLLATIRLMADNLEQPLAIPVLAERAGVSQRALEREFKRFTGKSVAGYYRTVRLDRARGLVTQTALPFVEVAHASGFASPEHFSRAYRSNFGRSPSEDRRDGSVPFEFRAWPSFRGDD